MRLTTVATIPSNLANHMTNEDHDLLTAISQRDAAAVRQHALPQEFIMIDLTGDDEDEEEVGALTAEIDNFEALVIFTTEDAAHHFVEARPELFEDCDDVTGHVVQGESLLEFLPESFGLLVNPESDDTQVVDPPFLKEINSLQG